MSVAGEDVTNWMQIITLMAAVFAAIGAITSAIIGWRQYRLMKLSNQRKKPNIHCLAAPLVSQPNWMQLDAEIKNFSEFPLDIVGVQIIRPKDALLINRREALGHDSMNGPLLKNPLPQVNLKTHTPVDITLKPTGVRPTMHDYGDTATVTVFANISQSSFQNRSSIRVSLRWRDERAKIFTMDATITMTDSENVAIV
ncbi:hypothetical protein [Brucella pseudogrignonensis]|uniref:hypothetical protein n=1 Tax=Brucella pseudogrignonensis TaxID=419475 RepID=UPI000CFE1C3F|nr:hypothetical protein [Brucella pseudogrignonensis]MQP38627.1 hypothetical protein [Ochrobactrum sp. MYb237]PQZ43246.1 hypothetical protein CQ059_04735 [Brucella pseudogrignonensis]PRA42993.1 hypothetical protein CQ063_01220 [Brucella pseudogrignonensis]PRA72539.1 hypothetical protein CQ055_04360 [Brucella pseudogrignonensis]